MNAYKKSNQKKYDRISKTFREMAYCNKATQINDFCHVYFVYDYVDGKVTNWSLSEMNSNFPELIEMMIYEYMIGKSSNDGKLSSEEIFEFYSEIFGQIRSAMEKRFENEPDEFLYSSEAAKLMNCSEMLIRAYCKNGLIKAHKDPKDKTGRWLVSKHDLMLVKIRSEFSPIFSRVRNKQ